MYFTFSESNQTFQSLGAWLAKANVNGLARPEEVNIAIPESSVVSAGFPRCCCESCRCAQSRVKA
jgi:hypothetical protein